MLNFYVNDILDLAMINNGKFRKNCSNFNAKDAVCEIISIQQHKADSTGVNLIFEMEGFGEDENAFVICTDQQRFKQVMLNF